MEKKYFKRYKKSRIEMPNLVEAQQDSYQLLVKEGLMSLLKEFSPIKDYSEKKFELNFTDFELSEPKYDEFYAKSHKLTYEAPLRVKVNLKNKILGTDNEQEIFFSRFSIDD